MKFFDVKKVYLVKDKKGEVKPARLCLLNRDDLSEVLQFNRSIYKDIGNDEIYAEDNSIEKNLNGEGFAIGFKIGALLIAMCVFSWVLEDMSKVLEDTYMEGRDLSTFAMRDIVVVDREYRGNGLHRKLISASEYFIPKDKPNVISTVAPINWPSLRNILASGYYVVACKELYGGHSRFITWQDLSDPLEVYRSMPFDVSVDNFRGHQMALDVGGVGFALEKYGSDIHLKYGRAKRKNSTSPLLFGGQKSSAS